jgi:hypothetical protein
MVGGTEAKECWGVVWALIYTARDEGLGTGDEGTALSNSQGRETGDESQDSPPGQEGCRGR